MTSVMAATATAPTSAFVPSGTTPPAAVARLLRPAASNPAVLSREDIVGGDDRRRSRGGTTLELRKAIDACVAEHTGPVPSAQIAEVIIERYRALEKPGRMRFLLLLANEYGLDRGGLKRAVKTFVETSIRRSDLRSEQRLTDAVAPKAAALFARMAGCPNGVLDLIALRGDLLTFLLDPLLAVAARPEAGAAASTEKAPSGPTSATATATATAASALQETVQLLGRFLTADDRRGSKPPATGPASAGPAAVSPGSIPLGEGAEERELLPPTVVVELARRVPALAEGDLVTHVDGDTLSQLQRLDGALQRLIDLHIGPGHLSFTTLTYWGPLRPWSSAAATINRLPAFEAVHPIGSLRELRARLDRPDRRCFGLFHVSNPIEPLIVVHVALLSTVPTHVLQVLAPDATLTHIGTATVAAFYSISAAHPGLRGASLGNLLIRRVLAAVPVQFPSVTTFVTLSPVPGFRRWSETSAVAREVLERLVSPAMRQRWAIPAGQDGQRAAVDRAVAVGDQIASDGDLRHVLVRLCARYLVGPHSNVKQADPVARFHLTNGARLDAIHWAAQASEKRLKESWGIMVTYAYDRHAPELDRNCESFRSALIVARSPAVEELYATALPPAKAHL